MPQTYITLIVVAVAVRSAVAINNGLGRVPMMGWNTWCTDGPCFQDVCTQDEVKAVVTAMSTNGLYNAGWNWISFDDCWEADTRDAKGDLQADPTRFPDGMEAMVDFIHAHNFSVQIYTSLGYSTCSRSGRPLPLPGSYGHEVQDAAWFASVGADGMKGDWCNTSGLVRETVTGTMAAAINETNHPLWFNFHCDGEYATWCPQAGVSSRVDHDHQDYWNRSGYGTKYIINDARNISSLGGAQGAATGGGYWWPDLDFLMTGGQGCASNTTQHCPGQSDIEYRTEFTFWTMIRSVLLFATDPRNLTAVMREALFNTELLAISQAPCAAPGIVQVAQVPCGSTELCQVWSTQTFCDGNTYVALLNGGEATASFTLQFDVLPGLSTATVAVARDLWAHQDLGTFTGSFPARLATLLPHATMALQLRPTSAGVV